MGHQISIFSFIWDGFFNNIHVGLQNNLKYLYPFSNQLNVFSMKAYNLSLEPSVKHNSEQQKKSHCFVFIYVFDLLIKQLYHWR